MAKQNQLDDVYVKDLKIKLSWFGSRHLQCLLYFTLLVIAYGMRSNLSVGIVAMTDPEANPDHDFPTYDWDNKSTILSSFFWGYIILQIPAGLLIKRYGAKWFLVASMTITSIFSILIPPMASLGSWGVMLCRILQGFGQGVIFPALHHLLGRWIPTPERSTLGTFAYLGSSCGTVISMPFTGWVSSSAAGWPTAFYVYGAAGLIWTVLWVWLGYNAPKNDKSIDPNERLYIESTTGNIEDNKHEATPWKDIMLSIPFWVLLITYCCQLWGFLTLLTEIPSYMKEVLGYDIKSNGFLSACPYLASMLFAFAFGPFLDFIINRKYVSRGVGRKIATSIGMYSPALFLLLLGLIVKGSEDKELALAFLISGVGLNSAQLSGVTINHIDLSPNHAGTLMAITNCIGNIISILAPLIVGVIVTDETKASQWNTVFFISVSIYLLGGTLFNIFASGEVQKWDKPKKKPVELDKTMPKIVTEVSEKC